MTDGPEMLLKLLADGQPHSGEALGEALGISRAAVWKQIGRLREAGLPVSAVAGAGYRLDEPLTLLSAEAIRTALPFSLAEPPRIDVHFQVDSTNRLAHEAPPGEPLVVLAERQTAGRGRRGRSWVSPLGASLYLSLSWPFQAPARGLSGLSLLTGLCVAEALEQVLGLQPQLKWPNDLMYQGRKLAGILIELSGEPDGPCRAVIGIGVNCRLPEEQVTAIDQPWTDLYRATGQAPDRNRIAAAILTQLATRLPVFERQGFQTFQADWASRDMLQGEEVVLHLGKEQRRGVAVGVDGAGALLMATAAGTEAFAAGEVSVRLHASDGDPVPGKR
ncbi:MAG: bifunctional biotin--[acetyl-CoA-carboxylase] ligase/biotin operon repressor BirA [Ectothiorhodospiraceae bacterium]|nr:bifunctional biotin--[acetyl-CoA-carboxylase] ligase/biotin operon repressor BirA [Ectothiorhodospiraceae bacterium]